MKNNIFTLTAIIAVSLAVTLSVNYFIFAWTPPDADPPGGTVPGLPTNPWTFNGTEIYYDVDNVGIGNTDPTQTLDVSGNVRVRNLDCTGNTNGGALTTDASGNISCSDDNSGTSLWQLNGSEIYYITDNVGIGTNNPGARLEVEDSGGFGGIRIDNSGSDANLVLRGNQAAAIYLTRNNTNPQSSGWAMSMDSSWRYNIGSYSAGVYTNAMQITGTTVNFPGTISKGGGSFLIDHPLDPKNKYLRHSFVESPEMRNIYYGQSKTNDNNKVIVALPEWWQALNGYDKSEYNYQITAIGQFCDFFISEEIENNEFEVTSDKANCKFSWTVSAIRHDAFAENNRIIVEEKKSGKAKGKCIHTEACNNE